MKTKNYLLLLVLTFSISSNTFICAHQFENARLKDIEDKINQSNQNAEVKRNALIVGAFLGCVTALGSWTYYLKRTSDRVLESEEKNKQREGEWVRLHGHEKEVERLNKVFTGVDGSKMKELVEIFNNQISDGIDLSELTLAKLLAFKENSDKSNYKKDDENVLFKIVEGTDGIKPFVSGTEKLRCVRDAKMATMNISTREINVMNRVLGDLLVSLEQVPAQNAPQPEVVFVDEAEKE